MEKKRALLLLTTSIGAFLTPFTSTVLSFIVPVLGREFKAPLYMLVYVPTAFLIPVASMMMLLGRLADLKGRVRFFRAGFALYVAGSILGYFAPNVYLLIASSLIMGLGSSILSAGATAIVSQAFEDMRGLALGVNAMAVYLGLTSAPFLGGLITSFFSWRGNMLVSLALAAAGALVSLESMKGYEFRVPGASVDYLGSATFTPALVLITTYLIVGDIYGWLETAYVGLLGLAFLVAFLVAERRTESPLIDISLFTKNLTFTAGNLTALLNYISTFSVPFLFSLYLQALLGLSPFAAGLPLVTEPVLMAALSPVSGHLSDRYSPRVIAALGMAIIGLSLLFLALLSPLSPVKIAALLAVLGTGFGLFSAPNTNSVMSSVSRDKYGVASGTLGTMRFTGQLLSIALGSAILVHYMGRYAALYMFTGVLAGSSGFSSGFLTGLKAALLFSAALSLLGVYTSLLTR